jgi:Leucine-rich repeat (LRR) protein
MAQVALTNILLLLVSQMPHPSAVDSEVLKQVISGRGQAFIALASGATRYVESQNEIPDTSFVITELRLVNAHLKDVQLLGRLSALERIELSGSDLTDDAAKALSQLKRLREIHLEGNRESISLGSYSEPPALTTATIANLTIGPNVLKWVGRSPALIELRLDNCGLHGASLKDLESAARLSTLELTGIPDDAIAALPSLPSLHALSVERINLGRRELETISRQANLKQLRLRGTRAGDDGMAHLRSLSRLSTLDLGHTQITDDTLSHLATIATLSHLSLDGTRITNAGIAHLSSLENLKILDLGSTQVSGRGIVSLEQLPRLRSLSMTNSGMTRDEITLLTRLRRLEQLRLGGMKDPITSVELSEIARLVELRELRIHGVELTKDGVRQLARLQKLEGLMLTYNDTLDDQALNELGHHRNLRWLSVLGGTRRADADCIERLRVQLPECDIRIEK